MVLQHACIVVSPGYLIIHVDQEDIVDTRVLEIVQSSRDQATHLLKVVQL